MEKTCFIMMPISDPDGYAQGHFNRVYQYLIVPACKAAGFTPIRADDPTVYYTPSDIIKNIIESDIAICDLSTKNSNALYGFAIRQSIDLPVTLIRDLKTRVIFNTQEFGEVEYDESLRIDTVQKEIETLSDLLKKTFANKAEKNSLLSRLDIGSVQLPEIPTMSVQEESNEKKESQLPIISPLPDFVGDPISRPEEIDKLKIGDFIFHLNYGKGEIVSIKKMAKDKMAEIRFELGSKTLVLMTSGFFRKINA